MIKINIELYPLGFKEFKKKLGEIHLINDRTGTKEIGNYVINFYNEKNEEIEKYEVKNFKRLEKSVFDLLEKLFINRQKQG